MEDVGSKQDENERDNPVAPPVEYAENKWMVSEPSADETPHGDKGTIPRQDQPELSSSDHKEGDVDAYIVSSIRNSQERDGGHAEVSEAKPFRLRSPRVKQQPYADCQRY